jgi:hypothetical protein
MCSFTILSSLPFFTGMYKKFFSPLILLTVLYISIYTAKYYLSYQVTKLTTFVFFKNLYIVKCHRYSK